MITIYLCFGSFMFGLSLGIGPHTKSISGLFLLCMIAWPWLVLKIIKKPEQEL